jgi:hypothetical protein
VLTTKARGYNAPIGSSPMPRRIMDSIKEVSQTMRRGELRIVWSCILSLLTVLLFTGKAAAQIPSLTDLSDTIEVGTVSVVFGYPAKAQIPRSQLATQANVDLLASVKTVCVLPYDGWKAKEIIDSLPSFDLVRSGLEGDKRLRQLRNEAAEQLTAVGFEVSDCLSDPPAPTDAELVFTNVRGGVGPPGEPELPGFYWTLYGPPSRAVTVHGEKELIGLGSAAVTWLPSGTADMAKQVLAVVNAAKSFR